MLSKTSNKFSAYLAGLNPSAAAAVLNAIERVISRLDRFPRSAPETEIAGVRATLRFDIRT
jgi:hypothetical protein